MVQGLQREGTKTHGEDLCRGGVDAMSEERGAGLATDDTDATDIHRLPCASVVYANRCYLYPLWAK